MEVDEEYSAYVAARWPVLGRSAVMLGCALHEAEDLAQSTLVKCFVAWDKVSRASNPDAYVYRILVNTHRSSHRRSWREHPVDQLPETGTRDVDTVSASALTVQQALAGLSAAGRAVVVLRFFADFSEQQTAEVLGVPAGTVKSRLSRALTRLAATPELADLMGRSRP